MEKESFDPGTKEFLIREILAHVSGPTVADINDPQLDELSMLLTQGFQYKGFFSELLAAAEAQGRTFSTKLLGEMIDDLFQTNQALKNQIAELQRRLH